MNTIISRAVRRTVISTLATLALATALPQAGLAAYSVSGIWKVDHEKSKFGSRSVTLTIEQVGTANPAPGNFIVVSNGSVYWVTGTTAHDRIDIQPANFARLTGEGKAVLIGTKPRATNHCGSNCQFGVVGPRMTLTFHAVRGAGQYLNNMLAQNKQ